ncbi:MAG: FtsX-like permease family protein [Planctomycetota bacterium]|jgi:ABC-type lipoprotein release transport system permease subunit
MTLPRFIANSLTYHWRSNLLLTLMSAMTAMVLTGALLVGESVRESLARIVGLRLGQVVSVTANGEHFFTAELAQRVQSGLASEAPPIVTPALAMRAIASTQGGSRRARDTQIGVEKEFFRLAPTPFTSPLHSTSSLGNRVCAINRRLAKKLNAEVGSIVLIRMEKPEVLPRDVPLTSDAETTVTLRLSVTAILNDDHFGRFSLNSDQLTPFLLFLDRRLLAERIDRPQAANRILASTHLGQAAIQRAWRLEDTGLHFQDLPDGGLQLESEQVFLPREVAKTALEPTGSAQPLFTYFVNALEHKDRSCPYSFVGTRFNDLPRLKQGEILINRWLADDLKVREGDKLTLRFFQLSEQRRLREASASFQVKSILPITGTAADRQLTPHFPGLSESDSCAEWDPGLPIDLDRIRKKDEAYWETYRDTPKAFIHPLTAKALWSNRYGEMTAIRWPAGALSREELTGHLLHTLSPASIGIHSREVRTSGLAESQSGVDFSGLFIGLSFFIIAAVLTLLGLAFTFSLETREADSALLRTLGFSPRLIRHALLGEALIPALFGSLLGALLGQLYNQAMVAGLSGAWRGAVHNTPLQAASPTTTLLLGGGLTLLTVTAVLLSLIRKQGGRSIRQLLVSTTAISAPRWNWRILLGALLAPISLVLPYLVTPSGHAPSSQLFFGAGGLLLLSGLCLLSGLIPRLHRWLAGKPFTLKSLTLLSLCRRPGRSLTAAGALACGVFLIVAISANRQGQEVSPQVRRSGTGGYALYGSTALPVYHDLNAASGRDLYGLKGKTPSFLPVTLHEGDDASCFNLNRVTRPHLLGLSAHALDLRQAFIFNQLAPTVDPAHPWLALEAADPKERLLPAVADTNTILWGLGLSIGDEIEYLDEAGHPFRVRLVGGLSSSIFQGSLLVSQKRLREFFPSTAGARVLLVDHTPTGGTPEVVALEEAFSDVGLSLSPTAERLAQFNEIQNTYLEVFLLLGGLGVIIGTAGLGLILLRTALERRSEFATLRAIGYRQALLARLLVCEHLLLLPAGLGLGLVPGLYAVLPLLTAAEAYFPTTTIAGLLLGTVAMGTVCALACARSALHENLIIALREE